SSRSSTELDSHSPESSDPFTAVQLSPERIDFFAQLHRPPTGRNQFPDSRRELFDESRRTELFSEVVSNRGEADATRVTVSLIDSTNSSISHDRREPDHTVAEKPPDYSTVVLNDLINPTKPYFPVVKKDNDTPPPEYGNVNPFFK
ncbi:hypothetical protein AVEN_58525-1, partial [Araneus ventricosus]